MPSAFFHKNRIGLRTLAIAWLVICAALLVIPAPKAPSYSVLVKDANGELLHAYLTPDEKWRMKTELHEISPLLRKTILHKEDRYFFYHPGINVFAIGRAAVRNLVTGRRTSGASTITMQVVRMLEPRPRNIFSKVIESFRAVQLELKYSKKEILQLYFNLLPMGGNIEGIKSASWIYLNKNPDFLSLAEITAFSIVPNRPNSLRPDRYPAKLVAERNNWLQRFEKAGLFPAGQIESAMQEPLLAQRRPVAKLAPHISRKLRSGYLPADSFEIHSTLSLQKQLMAEKMVTDYVRPLRVYNIRQAAVVVINNQTHEVEAYVGSADFADTLDGGQVNGAAAVRQPGSTLKPLLYGLCMDAGLITPKMKIQDVPVSFEGFAPENYDQQFNGEVSMEFALSHSLNIPAVQLLRQLSVPVLIESLGKCQFGQVIKDEGKLGLSMILGGCGATLEDLTRLFSAFACEGLYYAPAFTRDQPQKTPLRILSPASSYVLSDIMSSTSRPDFPIHWQATARLPRIAWKTGTSYGRRDAWSIGYNRHYTIGVWLGNFSGQGIPELSGAQIATPLLFNLFNAIDYGADNEWYQTPASLDSRIVCTESGLPPAPFCTSLTTDFFLPLISPTEVCHAQREVMISPDGSISYCPECVPPTGFRKKYYSNAGYALQSWQQSKGIPVEKVPPHNPDCQRVFSQGAPVISSPDNGTEYYLSKDQPEPIVFKSQTEADVARVYWYVNDKFYKSSPAGQPVFYLPASGRQKITCTDDKGRSSSVTIRITEVDL